MNGTIHQFSCRFIWSWQCRNLDRVRLIKKKKREISIVSELSSQLMSLPQITKHSLCLAKNDTQTGNRKVWHNKIQVITIDKQIYRYQTIFDKLSVSGTFIYISGMYTWAVIHPMVSRMPAGISSRSHLLSTSLHTSHQCSYTPKPRENTITNSE
jgi:hypothetical protein